MAAHSTAGDLGGTNGTVGVLGGEVRHTAVDGNIGLAHFHQSCQTGIDKFTLYNDDVAINEGEVILIYPLL